MPRNLAKRFGRLSLRKILAGRGQTERHRAAVFGQPASAGGHGPTATRFRLGVTRVDANPSEPAAVVS